MGPVLVRKFERVRRLTLFIESDISLFVTRFSKA